MKKAEPPEDYEPSEFQSFVLKEYERCWDYLQFQYEQRDRSQRFYFTLIFAAGGLAGALLRPSDSAQVTLDGFIGVTESMKIPLLFVLVPIVLLGWLTLAQLIHLRRTTTLFHKSIIAIRARYRGVYRTPLALSDDQPRYYDRGFNRSSAWILMLVTATVAAWTLAVGVLGVVSLQNTLAVSGAGGVVTFVLQYWWYRRVLRSLDAQYLVIFGR